LGGEKTRSCGNHICSPAGAACGYNYRKSLSLAKEYIQFAWEINLENRATLSVRII
jgi:hypothetical protein